MSHTESTQAFVNKREKILSILLGIKPKRTSLESLYQKAPDNINIYGYFQSQYAIDILKERGFLKPGDIVVSTGSTPIHLHLPTNVLKITKVD